MVFQAQQPRIQLKYLPYIRVYVGTRSENKNEYMDCRDFLLIKGVDIPFTSRSLHFWICCTDVFKYLYSGA